MFLRQKKSVLEICFICDVKEISCSKISPRLLTVILVAQAILSRVKIVRKLKNLILYFNANKTVFNANIYYYIFQLKPFSATFLMM